MIYCKDETCLGALGETVGAYCHHCGSEVVTVRNLTPHSVDIHSGRYLNGDEVITSIPPEPTPARRAVDYRHVGIIGVFPVVSAEYGEVEGLPEEKAFQFFIVSELVKSACPERRDLLSPADLIRDEAGRIVGCRSLVR